MTTKFLVIKAKRASSKIQNIKAMERRFLSIREAAKYSSLSTRFLYEKCQNRELRFSKVGKRIVIDSQDLHDFIIQNTVEPVEDWSEKLGLK